MRNMRKAIKASILAAGMFVVSIAVFAKDVVAAGLPYLPYNPYESHIPRETGLDTSIFYIAAAVLFVIGFMLLFTVKSIKEKIND